MTPVTDSLHCESRSIYTVFSDKDTDEGFWTDSGEETYDCTTAGMDGPI